MAKIFRIYDHENILGCIVAVSKEAAQGYAIGKYGAGANVERVSTKAALGAAGLCILISTERRNVPGTFESIRVIS